MCVHAPFLDVFASSELVVCTPFPVSYRPLCFSPPRPSGLAAAKFIKPIITVGSPARPFQIPLRRSQLRYYGVWILRVRRSPLADLSHLARVRASVHVVSAIA